MLYMVIERFKDPKAIYRRLRDEGRFLPAGIRYVSSWVEPNYDRCWQVIETDDPNQLEEWTSHWRDLAEFEIVPVVTSKEAAELIGAQL